MTDLLALLAILATITAIMMFILAGPRTRPTHTRRRTTSRRASGRRSDVLDQAGTPTSMTAAAILSIIAAAELAGSLGTSNATTGALTGLLIAVLIWAAGPSAGRVLSILCFLTALVMLTAAILEPTITGPARIYRALTAGLVLTLFALTTTLSGRWRYTTTGGRGYTLLGLADIVAFTTSPLGADYLTLPGHHPTTLLLLTSALAITLGAAASEITIYTAATTSTLITLALATTPHGAHRLTYLTAAAVVYLITTRLTPTRRYHTT